MPTATGFEPATAGSEVQRAIQLRHAVARFIITFLYYIL